MLNGRVYRNYIMYNRSPFILKKERRAGSLVKRTMLKWVKVFKAGLKHQAMKRF